MSRYAVGSGEAPPASEAGWPAVRRLLAHIGGERTEPLVDVPEELAEWPRTLLPAVVVGALHGGISSWRDEPPPQRWGPPSPSANLQRWFRLSDRALRGGLALGSLAAVYFGVHALSSVHRGSRAFVTDGFNGGLAVAAVYGAHAAIRSPVWPPGGALAGRVGTIVVIGTLQGALEAWYHRQKQKEAAAEAAEEEQRKRAAALAQRLQGDAASVLLAQLEASLTAQQQQQEAGEQQQQQRRPDGE